MIFSKIRKCSENDYFDPKKAKNDPSKPPKWANFRPNISIFWVIYQPLKLKIQPKVCLLITKTMLKYFLNNSKTTLIPPKWSKTLQNCQNEQIFDRKFRFVGSFINLWSWKIHPKVGFLRSKTKPKHFLTNHKTTLKKSRKRLFCPQKWPKHGCQLGQKWRILGPFSLYEPYFCIVGTKDFAKIVPPDG